ncbi:riboflavin synthase [Alicyclobacillaceae bacterium I2511]|nr:riboflavin synthase [Alicyclobacillaceae bacterium I2511]
MFTGLVEEVGKLMRADVGVEGARLHIGAVKVLADMKLGDSIAINGACLTVVQQDAKGFAVEAVPETMRRTNLGQLRSGSPVNLERALRAGDRLGGHFVAGHVDGTGTVDGVVKDGLAVVITVHAPASLMRYIAEKGSICVDGVSLTVMDILPTRFRVSIIPHTASETTLTRVRVGDTLNLEVDMLAKYMEQLLQPNRDGETVNLDFLQRNGYSR